MGVKAAGTWTADARAGGGGRHARLRCSPVRSHRSCRLSRCASEVVVRRELWCVLCGLCVRRGGGRARVDRPLVHICMCTAQRSTGTAQRPPPRRGNRGGAGVWGVAVGARASLAVKRERNGSCFNTAGIEHTHTHTHTRRTATLSTSGAAWPGGDGAGPTPLASPLQLQPELRAQVRAPLLHAPRSRARACPPSQPGSSRSCAGLCCTLQSCEHFPPTHAA